MNQRLKENLHPKRFVFMLALLSCLFGIGIAFISDFLIVPFVAFFSSLLWFASEKKIICAIVPFIVLLVSLFNGIACLFAVSAGILCSLLLWCMYRFRCSKTDTVLAITAFFSFFLLLALYLSICNLTNEYSLSSALTFYENFIEQQKTAFIDAFSQIHIADENGVNTYLFSEDVAEAMFLSTARLAIAFLVVSAFFLCGLTCKIFSRIIVYAAQDETYIRSWRFTLPNIAIYFYIALFIISFFVSNEDILGIAVQNLSYIFMTVLAYLGLRYLLAAFSKIKRRTFALTILVFLILLLNVSAVQFLSFYGVYASIVSNRMQKE